MILFFARASAFEAGLKDSRPRLWRLAYSWCHNRATSDDLVQEALAKALDRHDQLRDPEALHGWLCSILARCWHDHLRARKDVVDIDEISECDLPICDDGPENDCVQNETIRRVRQAVARLPVGQREVITLVDLEEFSYAEVALVLDIPIGTVMSRLSRARIALREHLMEAPATVIPIPRMARVK